MREEGEVMFDVDFDAPTPLDSAPSGNGLDEVDCLDNDNLEGNGGYPDSDRPPSYRAISPPPSSSPRVRVGGTDAGAGQPKQSAGPAGPGAPDGMEKPDDETELVEIKHSIVRSDTLISIARKYAADVSGVSRRVSLSSLRRRFCDTDHLGISLWPRWWQRCLTTP